MGNRVPDCNGGGARRGYSVPMATVFTKLPGARDRSLVNCVPGFQVRGSNGIRGPETGAALELTKRRERWGKVVGLTCFVLSVIFAGAVLLRLVGQEWWTETDALIFDWIWFVSCAVVHVGVFAAEGLRGRDAPWGVWAVVVFWIGQFGMWFG